MADPQIPKRPELPERANRREVAGTRPDRAPDRLHGRKSSEPPGKAPERPTRRRR
jgi:hypothetical protein